MTTTTTLTRQADRKWKYANENKGYTVLLPSGVKHHWIGLLRQYFCKETIAPDPSTNTGLGGFRGQMLPGPWTRTYFTTPGTRILVVMERMVLATTPGLNELFNQDNPLTSRFMFSREYIKSVLKGARRWQRPS
ncbi:hypothetical protein EG328_005889 [Venturia inaequalis]|uniref:Uncharacterized protein n=1 Tax=Venturia inaequalis TaxID=5025 RepID=A0A8H3VD93_VENIN|nr:hypothetical protein EG328_005889 [Venturia inaequalis]RDI76362.1 hypothetical protein Vi05172_g13653 [Venturia inaequalis]